MRSLFFLVKQIVFFKILYDLARMDSAGLIMISNEETALYDADPRVRSSLASVENIHFPRYSFEEIKDILKDRIEWGLLPGTIAARQVDWIARVASGDARVALNILRLASEAAENRDKEKIPDDHIKAALPKAQEADSKTAMDRLNSHQKILYEMIKQTGEIRPDDLYQEYEKACGKMGIEPVVDRSVRKQLAKLAQYRLIQAKGEGRWRVYTAEEGKA
ncbi:MAG: hypothetical protein HY518_05200 [Candidatus Aenigmarchaeota archaeon]|nr:hypothetical protein [Candidatus Aenigmarchaeota archaeon]